MIIFDEVASKPRMLLSFTGLTVDEFSVLPDKFSSVYEIDKQKRYYKKEVDREIVGGDKEILSLDEDKLFVLQTLSDTRASRVPL